MARRRNIVFICQAVDRDDPVLASTLGWIAALSNRPDVERVTVLALRTGDHELPANVVVRRCGGRNRFVRLVVFYRELARSLRPRPDLFFVYQGGPYPLLLLPLKAALGVPIVQWKAHPVINRAMVFYARWCDDLVFTSTPAAFPISLPNVRVVGQGIDSDRFRIEDRPLTGDLITTSRITPRKRLIEMVEAVACANRRFGTGYRLAVYGPTLTGDEAYAAELERVIDGHGAREWVALKGPVPHADLPAILNSYRVFLNFAQTALDRSVVEAMACGLPVLSTNASVAEIMPRDLHPMLITNERSRADQAEAIHRLLSGPEGELTALGRRMRELAVAEHSRDRLFERIMDETERALWARN